MRIIHTTASIHKYAINSVEPPTRGPRAWHSLDTRVEHNHEKTKGQPRSPCYYILALVMECNHITTTPLAVEAPRTNERNAVVHTNTWRTRRSRSNISGEESAANQLAGVERWGWLFFYYCKVAASAEQQLAAGLSYGNFLYVFKGLGGALEVRTESNRCAPFYRAARDSPATA